MVTAAISTEFVTSSPKLGPKLATFWRRRSNLTQVGPSNDTNKERSSNIGDLHWGTCLLNLVSDAVAQGSSPQQSSKQHNRSHQDPRGCENSLLRDGVAVIHNGRGVGRGEKGLSDKMGPVEQSATHSTSANGLHVTKGVLTEPVSGGRGTQAGAIQPTDGIAMARRSSHPQMTLKGARGPRCQRGKSHLPSSVDFSQRGELPP